VKKSTPGIQHLFVGPVLKPKETHSLYALLLAFYWLGGDFLFVHFHLIA
jgi:hypothetical protein